MTTLKSQIINAVVTAGFLAAGGTIVGLKVNDARQDQNIQQLQSLHEDVTGLRTDLANVDKKLEHVSGQLEEQDRERSRH